MFARIVVALSMVLGLLSLGAPAVWADDDDDIDELVVKLDLSTGVTIEDINQQYGTTTLSAVLSSRGIYLLRVPPVPPVNPEPDDDDDDDWDADDWEDLLEMDPRILYAEPNFESEIPESGGNFTWTWGGEDDEPRGTQYARTTLALDTVHEQSRGAGVVVAVLDTGVQLDHPALRDHLTVARFDFIDDDAEPNDVGNGLDDDGDGLVDEAVGHGTHVAGIVLLVAPDAQIMPVRVLNSDGRGDIFRIAEGLLFALENGAHVINLSLGSAEDSDLLEDIIEDAWEDYGILFVAAAGNLNSNVPQFPAEEDEVIGVSAVDELNRKADFANFGDWIDVVAPGVGIYSTVPENAFAGWSGTSMATPMVAGQAAILRSLAPEVSGAGLRRVIRSTAQPVDAVNPSYAGQLGRGVIDIAASVNELCAQTPCVPLAPEPPAPEEPAPGEDEPVPGEEEPAPQEPGPGGDEPIPGEDEPAPEEPAPGDENPVPEDEQPHQPAPGDGDVPPVPESPENPDGMQSGCPCRVWLPGIFRRVR